MSVNRDILRQSMPIAKNWAYFDHAAVAPLPAPTRDAMVRWSHEASEQGDTVWPTWAARVESIRRTAAAMINAQPEEIAFVQNTTGGVNLVAEGFPWSEGDNVVTLANEFPTNLFPWQNLTRQGVETRTVEPRDGAVLIDDLLSACDDRTRIVSVSWVGYGAGWRMDVDELTRRVHDRGILLFLDAIQGLGVFPMDVVRTPVDFLAGDGHKWMLGPEGAGMFYVRREHLDLLQPLGIGWNSVKRPYEFGAAEFDLKETAGRYEGGSYNMAGILGFGASLDLLAEWGLAPECSTVADYVLEITDLACDRLREELGAQLHSHRDGNCRSGIVSFTLPESDAPSLRRHCLREGVVLSCREGRLRISPHAYNDEEDIGRLIRALHKAKLAV